MKKAAVLFLVLVLCTELLSPAVLAEDATGPTFTYDLSVGGSHELLAVAGDIVEVTFSVLRTDADEAFDCTALQNRIVFDETFFAFVDASCTRVTGYSGLKKTLSGARIYMTDMMDTLEPSLVFGTFRLKVIAVGGEGWVRSGSAKLQRLGGTGIEDAQISCMDLCVRYRGPGGELSECTSEGAAAAVRNLGESTAPVTCILAAYDKGGRMLAVDRYSGELPAGERAPLTVRAAGVASVKLFLLDRDSGKPLCDTLSRTADGS